MSRAFDEMELLQRVGGDWEFLGETVQLLSEDGPALLEQIRRATESGDATGVGRGAHALKGMISNFCSPAAHATAHEVERLGNSGELPGVPPALRTLEAQLAELIADLTAFVATRA